MTSDFFEQQDVARRKTGRLVFFFALAIICLITLVYGLLIFIGMAEGAVESPWQPMLLLTSAAGVGAVVGLSSLIKVSQLASGGQSVALMMGGAEVPGTTTDLHERRLLNIVEEMAIAAGVPVPPVYILDEPGINAFAAGYAPGDAVVAVSKGCLQYLSRDELQGVVALEFSHILNGDMRLNIRLIAIIFGIMVLSIIGRILMNTSGRSRSSSDRNSGGGIVLLGIGLFILGLVGAFFGRLIQSAVSRQREYLADASAVQFTRNPDGIAGALKKIGGLQQGSRINNPRAGEVGHMFFANGLSMGVSGLLATHPPLEDRIRRLDPQFNGEYPVPRPVGVDAAELQGPKKDRVPPFGKLPTIPGMPQVPIPVLAAAAESTVSRVGDVTPKEISYAEDLHDDIPDLLIDASREPFSARALIYALLLDSREDIRNAQLSELQAKAPAADFDETRRLIPVVHELHDAQRLPLVDLAMPALRQMSPRQHAAFRDLVEELVGIDQKINLFEYTLRCVLHRHLDAQFMPQTRPRTQIVDSVERLAQPFAQVLALVAWEDPMSPEDAARAFAAGMQNYTGSDRPFPLPPREQCSLASFDAGLRALEPASPNVKRRIIAGCTACILADHVVTVREAEILRAICDTLDCPLPPLAVTEPATA